jgi:hypothetical protein
VDASSFRAKTIHQLRAFKRGLWVLGFTHYQAQAPAGTLLQCTQIPKHRYNNADTE